jgi:hypothetical protein
MAKNSRHNRSAGPAGEITVDEALRLMKPTAHITDVVKGALAVQLPGISSSVFEIAQMKPLRLAAGLIGLEVVIPSAVTEEDLLDVARELISSFRAMLDLDSSPPPGSVNVAVSVETATAGRPRPRPRPRPQPPRAEDECRKLLLNAAEGRRTAMSGSLEIGPVVVDSFSTMSGSVHLNGTIVLGNSSTMSGSLNGTAYVPAGTRISTMSGSNRLAVHAMSYADLARRAGLA